MTALPLRDFTAAEQDKLDAIEAAPAEPESLRERLEDALAIELDSLGLTGEVSARACIYLADAAIAVLSGPSSDAEQAVERVRALADKHEECCSVVHVDILRATIAGPSC
jgi:hypothetical protein